MNKSFKKTLLAGMGAALVGSAVYHRLSGYWPLVNELDELSLGRSSLQHLAEFYLRNPRRSNLVVCLTTIPSRLERLDNTLKSLLRQRVRPAEIRLHLPYRSLREQTDYQVPDWLARLPAVSLVRCEDYGPATKLIPSVLELGPDQPILVVDDDRIYPPTLIEDLEPYLRRYPEMVVSNSGWSVPADLTDRPTTLKAVLSRASFVPVLGSVLRKPVQIDVFQGVHGYVVRPRFFDKAALVDYSQAPPEARYCDDVWLSAQARVTKVAVPVQRIGYSPRRDTVHYKVTSLARNFNSKQQDEERGNTVMIRYFKHLWPELRAETLE